MIFLRITAALLLLCLIAPVTAPAQSVALSPEEWRWLDENRHQIALWYDAYFPPIEFHSPEDRFDGMGAEVMALIEQRLGVTFRKTPSRDWNAQLNSLETGESAIAPVIVPTEERARFAFFSAPYLNIPTVIITTRDKGSWGTRDLVGRRVAVVRGYVSEKFLREKYGAAVTIYTVPDTRLGLRAVSLGEVDAMVENLAVAAYYIDQEKLPNLKVAGTTELVYSLSFAVSRKYPLLFSAMQKAMADIPPAEIKRIEQKWISLQVPILSHEEMLLLQFGGAFLTLTLATLGVMSLILKRRLTKNRLQLERTEEELRRKSQRLSLAFEAANDGLWDWDIPGGNVFLSPRAFTMLDYEPGGFEESYEGWKALIHPDDLAGYEHVIADKLLRAEPYEADFRVRSKSGEWRWIYGRGRVVEWDAEGRPKRAVGTHVDITERKMGEAALAESEARFRTIFENAPYAIAINRASDGSYVDVNKAMLRSQGMTKDEILKRTPHEVAGVSAGETAAIRRQILETGGIRDVEASIALADGRTRQIVYSSVPISFGGEQCLLSMTIDVTERKRAETALLESEKKYRDIFNNTPSGIFRTTFDGRVIDANPALARMLGYDSRQDLLTSVRELARDIYPHPDDRHRMLEELLRTPSGLKREVEFRRKDGTAMFGVLNVSLQFDEHGNPCFLDGTVEDITERRRAEDALRQSEEKFSRLFRLSPDAIIVMELESRRIHDANEACERLFGLHAPEIVGKTIPELNIHWEGSKYRELFDQVRRSGTVENMELFATRTDGTSLVCSASGQVLNLDETQYLMCVIRDMTETKKMQAMMIQTEKMLSVGGIAAGIAHEINNPLGIILNTTQNIAQRTKPDFARNIDVAKGLGLDLNLMDTYLEARGIHRFIEDIRTAAIRAAGIIRHMLDFSRTSESRRKVCDIPAIIDRAVELAANDYDLKKNYDFRQVKIVREYGENLPVINCTETEIEQVLLNLLRNAGQAMAMADPPTPDPCIRIRLDSDGVRLRIDVEDNGPGMPADVQRRVFEPFFTTKAQGVGTGLGLSVSSFIVSEGHKGSMRVESTPGKGTTFIVELPVCDGAPQSPDNTEQS